MQVGYNVKMFNIFPGPQKCRDIVNCMTYYTYLQIYTAEPLPSNVYNEMQVVVCVSISRLKP